MARKTKTKTEEQTEVPPAAASRPSRRCRPSTSPSAPFRRVAEAVRTTADTWRKSETRSQEIETLQKRVQTLRDPQARTNEIESLRQRLGSELEKAEARAGTSAARSPTSWSARPARRAIGSSPRYRERVEPVVKERVEPIYRDRVEPAVKRVRERI